MNALAEWLSQPAEFRWVRQLWKRWRNWLTGEELTDFGSRQLHRETVHVHPNNEIVVDDGNWRVEFGRLGKDSRVSFNGEDISNHIYAMKVETEVGHVTTLTLNGYCLGRA